MAPQPHVQHTASDSASRSSATRAAVRTDHSWSDDPRGTRAPQGVPDTTVPASQTAISQADGEA